MWEDEWREERKHKVNKAWRRRNCEQWPRWANSEALKGLGSSHKFRSAEEPPQEKQALWLLVIEADKHHPGYFVWLKYMPTKVCLVKAMVFPVVMYG